MGELAKQNKLENFQSIDEYLDVVGRVESLPSLNSSEKQENTQNNYNLHKRTTFHFDHETKKILKVFQCCNIKTLFLF